MTVTESQLQAARDLFDKMGEPLPDIVTRAEDMKTGVYVEFVDGQTELVWYTCSPRAAAVKWVPYPSRSLGFERIATGETLAWRVVGDDRTVFPTSEMGPLERIRRVRPLPRVGDVVPRWMVPPRTIVQDPGGASYLMRFEDKGEVVYIRPASCKSTNDGLWLWSDNNRKPTRVVALDVDPTIDNAGVQRIVDADIASRAVPTAPKVGDVVAWADVPPCTIVRNDGWLVIRCDKTGEYLGTSVDSASREHRGDTGDWLWTSTAHTPRDGVTTIVAVGVDIDVDMDALRPAMWAYLRTLTRPGAKVSWHEVPPGTLVRTHNGAGERLRRGDECVDVESGLAVDWRKQSFSDVDVLAVDVPFYTSTAKLRQLAIARSPERPIAMLYKELGEEVPEPVRLRDAPAGAYATTRPDTKCQIEFVCLVDQNRYAWTTGGASRWEPDPAAWLWPIAGFRRELLIGELNEHVPDDAMSEVLCAVFAAHSCKPALVQTVKHLRILACGAGVKVGDEVDALEVPVHALVRVPGNSVALRHLGGGELIRGSTTEQSTRTSPLACCEAHGRWAWERASFVGQRVKILALGVSCSATAADIDALLAPAKAIDVQVPGYVRVLFENLGDPSLPAATRLADAPPGLYAVDPGLVLIHENGRRVTAWGGIPAGEGQACTQEYGWIAAAAPVPPSFPPTMLSTLSRVRHAREYRPNAALPPGAGALIVNNVSMKYRRAIDHWSGCWRHTCTPVCSIDVDNMIRGKEAKSASLRAWLPRIELQQSDGRIVAAAWTVGHIDGLVKFAGRTPTQEEAMCAAVDHAARLVGDAEQPDRRLWTGDGLGPSAGWTGSALTSTLLLNGQRPCTDLSAVLGTRVSGTAAFVCADSDLDTGVQTHGTRSWTAGRKAYVVGAVERVEDVPLWRLLVTSELLRTGIVGPVVMPDFSPIVVQVERVKLDGT